MDGHGRAAEVVRLGLEDALDDDAPKLRPEASAQDGRLIVEMIAAVFESHRLGRPVEAAEHVDV